jgi:hypothetical protein
MNFLKKINLKENQPLSVISWSNISFGVERYFQLYRGQTFHLVLNATFSYIVVKHFPNEMFDHDITESGVQHQMKCLITI